MKIQVKGSTFELVRIDPADAAVQLEYASDVTTLYGACYAPAGVNKNYRFYVGKTEDPKEVLFWYESGALHCSYGKNIAEAVQMGMEDGWQYTMRDES